MSIISKTKVINRVEHCKLFVSVVIRKEDKKLSI